LFVPGFPEILRDIFDGVDARDVLVKDIFWMNAGNQHIFVVGAVEYAKLTFFRQSDRVAPQVIVLQLFGSRCFKTMDHNPAGIEFLEYLSNKGIFSGSIHALKTD